MASIHDRAFIEFVEKKTEEGLSSREVAKAWIKKTGEKCSKSTVARALKSVDTFGMLDDMGLSMANVTGGGIGPNGPYLRFKKDNKIVSYHDVKDELIKEMNEYSFKYPKLKRQKLKNPNLLVINPADIHIGKMGMDGYDVETAINRVREGVLGTLDHYQNHNIDKIIFVGGNDILHTEGSSKNTTKGTRQDTIGHWYDNFKIAKALYVEIIEILLTVADVEFVFCPSNHDYATGFMLCDSVESRFKKNKNITFQNDMLPRKYVAYGRNLLGFCHNDGAKTADLPMLMATECEHWTKDQVRYMYGHHIHHKVAKDYIGVAFESVRSPSGDDMRHKITGYIGAPQAIEGFLHGKDGRTNGRFTYIF